VIINYVVWQNTSLTLRKEEKWQFLIKLIFASRRLVRVVNIKDASSEARSHLAAVVTVHAEGSALAQSLVPVGKLA
jgi:hypothetical protein